MGLVFFAIGSSTILRTREVRAFMDRFADAMEEGSWHPYRMPFWAMRMAGGVLIAIAFLLFWMARIGFQNL